jgi:BASS family bile acid:Na+ symporter
MQIFSRALFVTSLSSLVLLLISLFARWSSLIAPLLILFFSAFALYSMTHSKLKKLSFTIWVFAFVAASLNYPSAFGTWFGMDLAILIVPLIQIIMFGMGTTLSVKDFSRVIVMPWPVLVGFFLQFTIMPLTGLSLAMLFGFEPEIAAGVVLIGSCPGGVASNLMAYLAGGNVALSVTMTSCSTLISPVMTPFLMKTLAGRFVPIDFVAMMLSIMNMIIVPIIAGLVANRILYSKHPRYRNKSWLFSISIAGVAIAVILILAGQLPVAALETLRLGFILGFALIGIVALAKLIVNVYLDGPENWMDKTLPIVSMAGICFIIGIITARSSEDLLTTGVAIIAAAIIHNLVGYLLGYWLSRAVRLDETSARTVAFEVGMQNGGMASGLAMSVMNSAKTALAPAVFGPWMNISGSMLATWWHRKPVNIKKSPYPEST